MDTGKTQRVEQVPREIYQLIIRGMCKAEPHLQRRVRGLWANLAAKRQRRNDGLKYTAWQFAEFVESGDLDQEVAARLLWFACKANGYLAKDGHITADQADAFCRISTGTGYAKRALRTDADQFMMQVCRPILLNGIPDDLADRGDLADARLNKDLRFLIKIKLLKSWLL